MVTVRYLFCGLLLCSSLVVTELWAQTAPPKKTVTTEAVEAPIILTGQRVKGEGAYPILGDEEPGQARQIASKIACANAVSQATRGLLTQEDYTRYRPIIREHILTNSIEFVEKCRPDRERVTTDIYRVHVMAWIKLDVLRNALMELDIPVVTTTINDPNLLKADLGLHVHLEAEGFTKTLDQEKQRITQKSEVFFAEQGFHVVLIDGLNADAVRAEHTAQNSEINKIVFITLKMRDGGLVFGNDQHVVFGQSTVELFDVQQNKITKEQSFDLVSMEDDATLAFDMALISMVNTIKKTASTIIDNSTNNADHNVSRVTFVGHYCWSAIERIQRSLIAIFGVSLITPIEAKAGEIVIEVQSRFDAKRIASYIKKFSLKGLRKRILAVKDDTVIVRLQQTKKKTNKWCQSMIKTPDALLRSISTK